MLATGPQPYTRPDTTRFELDDLMFVGW